MTELEVPEEQKQHEIHGPEIVLLFLFICLLIGCACRFILEVRTSPMFDRHLTEFSADTPEAQGQSSLLGRSIGAGRQLGGASMEEPPRQRRGDEGARDHVLSWVNPPVLALTIIADR